MGFFDVQCSRCKENKVGIGGKIASKASGKVYQDASAMMAAEGSAGVGPFEIICEKICDECYEKGIAQDMEDAAFAAKLQGDFIISTTPIIEGRTIAAYKGFVSAQVFIGVNIFKDIASSFRDIVGGRSQIIERELAKGEKILISEIQQKALRLRANAVVGFRLDFENVTSGNAFMLLGTGTAIFLSD